MPKNCRARKFVEKPNSYFRLIGISLFSLIPGIFCFFVVIGKKNLIPTQLDWLAEAPNTDPLQAYLGWEFFRNSKWSIPLGLNTDFGMLQSNTIVYSDSIPLFSLFGKALTELLPTNFQYFGIWLLSSLLLHSYFLFKIAHLFTRNIWVCTLFPFLGLFLPFFLDRTNIHLALSGHFTIIAGIYLYLSSIQNRKKYLLSWIILLVTTVLIHGFLFAITGIVFAAHLLRLFISKIMSGYLIFKTVVLFMIFLWLVMNFIAGYENFIPDNLEIGHWGTWGWNVVSPFYPNGWSAMFSFFPAGKGNLETATYLGLGVLALIGVASTRLVWAGKYLGYWRRDLFPIQIASLVFLALAVTNQVSIGSWLIEMPFPKNAVISLSMFRASGRFIWPVLYLVLIFSFALVVKTFSSRTALFLVITLCFLQILDTKPGWSPLFTSEAPATSSILTKKFSSVWRDLSTRYSEIVVMRDSDYQVPGWPEVALIANSFGMRTNCASLSRANMKEIQEQSKEIKLELATGALRPNRIYVISSEFEFQMALENSEVRRNSKIVQLDEIKMLVPAQKGFQD